MDIALTQSVLLIFVLYVSSRESYFVVLVYLISACSSVVFNTRESYFVVLDLVYSFSVRSSSFFVPNGLCPNTERLASLRALRQFT